MNALLKTSRSYQIRKQQPLSSSLNHISSAQRRSPLTSTTPTSTKLHKRTLTESITHSKSPTQQIAADLVKNIRHHAMTSIIALPGNDPINLPSINVFDPLLAISNPQNFNEFNIHLQTLLRQICQKKYSINVDDDNVHLILLTAFLLQNRHLDIDDLLKLARGLQVNGYSATGGAIIQATVRHWKPKYPYINDTIENEKFTYFRWIEKIGVDLNQRQPAKTLNLDQCYHTLLKTEVIRSLFMLEKAHQNGCIKLVKAK